MLEPELGLLANPKTRRLALTVVAPAEHTDRVVSIRYDRAEDIVSVVFRGDHFGGTRSFPVDGHDHGGVRELLSTVLTVDVFHGDSERKLARYEAHTSYVVKLT